ncbi:MAG: rRNA maturation RNase YbeY [Candidatus Cloacimonetes bacterium]|nr:rRNA maturation RNase YbeY [Candidatus Cloacimonadota bacterium]
MNTQTPMSIEVINESQFEIDDKIFENVYEIISQKENFTNESSVCISLTNNEKIRELNKNYRGKNSITDVLSFTSNTDFIPFLGDIIINVDAAEKQKKNKSLTLELQRLFLHGLLHLLGNDHISNEQRDKMQKKEEYYWNLLILNSMKK